jgi:mono/diheme cytochrome c family protein
MRALRILSLTTFLVACAPRRHQASLSNPDPARTRFETYCAGCHLNEGQWMRGEAPPLEGSSWVSGPEDRLIRIVLHGLRGPIEVGGKLYNQEMPGFAPVLTDADIASLVSYVRRRFGQAATPVPEAQVSRIRAANPARKNYWTVEELMKEP